MKKHQIEIADLYRLLDLDRATGELKWKRRAVADYPSGDAGRCAAWNSRYAGKPALATKNGLGYQVGAIFGRNVLKHQVVFAMTRGEWASGEIDHINGVRSDNRPENLRDVSHRENLKNARQRSDNKSGCTGVTWNTSAKKWQAQVHSIGKNIYLGLYDTFDAAVIARRKASQDMGFHPNHGTSDQNLVGA